MHSRVAVVAVLAVLGSMGISGGRAIADEPPPTNPPGSVQVSCPHGWCGVGATDLGALGGGRVDRQLTGGTQPVDHKGGKKGNGQTPPVPTDPLSGTSCAYQPIPASQLPPAGNPLWEGHSPAEGTLMASPCGGTVPGYALFKFVAKGVPGAPPPPPPDPAVVAQQAYKQIPIPKPLVHFGPDPAQLAVKVPVWFWVDEANPAPVTVAVRGVSVTATAHLESVSWAPGEPFDPTKPGSGGVDPVVCTGSAMYAAPSGQGSGKPLCGYTYFWKSTASRTGGAEKWTVTATARWVIDWTATGAAGPAQGRITAPPAVSTGQVRVGQWTTIGVPPTR